MVVVRLLRDPFVLCEYMYSNHSTEERLRAYCPIRAFNSLPTDGIVDT